MCFFLESFSEKYSLGRKIGDVRARMILFDKKCDGKKSFVQGLILISGSSTNVGEVFVGQNRNVTYTFKGDITREVHITRHKAKRYKNSSLL